MNPANVRLDALGFPVPPTFDAPNVAEADHQPRRAARSTFAIRVFLVMLAVGAAVMALVRAELGEPIGQAIAKWLAGHAYQKWAQDDLDGALRDLDRALTWNDKSPEIFALHGEVLLEKGDAAGSLADFNKLVSLAPTSSDAYELRSVSLQRLKRHEDAIRDITQAVELRHAAPHLLNSRAYTRAIANRELQPALDDINQALLAERDNPHYLDTRGYIYFLLGEHEKALKDLERALQVAEQNAPTAIFSGHGAQLGRMLAREKRRYENALAVMYHHRGEIHAKLGHSEQAEADLRQGDAFGYNPEAGVY